MLYVEELIGPDTVNTLPPATLDAFRDHGLVAPTLESDLDGARAALASLAEVGIDLGAATERLQEEGLAKFAQPFDDLLVTLAEKREVLASTVPAESSQ